MVTKHACAFVLLCMALCAAQGWAADTVTPPSVIVKHCKLDSDCSDMGTYAYCMNGAGKVPPFVCHGGAAPSAPGSATSSKGPAAKKGVECTTDADCPQSYCLNYAPHIIKPYFCHDSDFPLCATPVLDCQHTGSLYEVSCETTTDCPKGSYCMNGPNKVRPFVCHAASAPACECDCNSGWIGNVCQKWNSTNSPSNNRKIKNYFAFLEAGEEAEQAKLAAEVHPFNGFVGLAVNMQTGTFQLPALAFSYENTKNTIGSYRLPDQVSFKQEAAGGAVSFTANNFEAFAPLREAVESQRSAMLSSQQSFVGLFKEQNDVGDYASFFRSNSAMGYVRQDYTLYEATLTAAATPDRWFSMGIDSLPTDYSSASAKAALQSFISTWGTHYVTAASLGGSIEMRSNYEWWLNAGTAWQKGLGNDGVLAQVTAHFELATGVDATSGSPLSSDEKGSASSIVHSSDGKLFEANSQAPSVSCTGGDAVEDCPSKLSAWRASFNPSSVAPIKVQLAPIYELFPQGAARDALKAAISQMMKAQEASWNSASTCPSCQHGSHCSEGQTSCTCPQPDHTYERNCGTCKSGYGGSDCAQPICEGCNHGGGSCVSPGHCQCHNCYAGPNCDRYTCGCFDGSGLAQLAGNVTMPLEQLRVGDKVLAVSADGSLTYSPVYYTAKSNSPGSSAEVVDITFGSGFTLSLTQEHLVHAVKISDIARDATFSSAVEIMARDVTVGQHLWTVSNDGKLQVQQVTDTHVTTKATQLVSVYTVQGPVVVNGVVASSYEWSSTVQALENLEARLMFTYLPSVATSQWYLSYCEVWDSMVTEPLQPVLRWLSEAVATLWSGSTKTAASTVVPQPAVQSA